MQRTTLTLKDGRRPPMKPGFQPGKAPPITEFVREFRFADGGRLITLDKRAIAFACPLKEDPDHKTLVGWRSAAGPVPLDIPYGEFMDWWLRERKSPDGGRA